MAQNTVHSSSPAEADLLPQTTTTPTPTSTSLSSPLAHGLRLGLIAAVALIVLGAFVVFGGVPTDDRAGIFWIATGVMIALLLGFAAATWHLLFRALPIGHRIPQGNVLALTNRALLGLLLGIASFSLIISTFWDELWHRQFGIPLGEDLLWRPHMMMYFTFGTVTILGFFGLRTIIRENKGTLQQRFRANPIMGLSILTGGFLMYVIPADPVWHAIYGDDISAWSIPHLLLVLCFITIMLLSVAYHMSTMAPRLWRGFWRMSVGDIIPLLMFACVQTIFLQFFTTEYDQGFAARAVVGSIPNGRPDWMLPLILVLTAAFAGVGIVHTTRRVGAATLSGLVALGIRVALLGVFDTELLHLKAPIVIMPALIAIDLWYAFGVSDKDKQQKSRAAWSGGAVAAVLATVTITIPSLFPEYYPYMQINDLSVGVGMMTAIGLLAALGGAIVGDYVGTANKDIDPLRDLTLTMPADDFKNLRARPFGNFGATAWVPLMSFGALLATVGFIIVFIVTAVPPA